MRLIQHCNVLTVHTNIISVLYIVYHNSLIYPYTSFIKTEPLSECRRINGISVLHLDFNLYKRKRPPTMEAISNVPGTGFEPAHPFERRHLKAVRLPISPPGPGGCKPKGKMNICKMDNCGVLGASEVLS
jgi:hypothetical protein